MVCDTILALKAGDYIATSFIVKDQKDQILEAAKVTAPNGFSIADNKETVADVPITMQETAPSIHDGIILKKIWEALDGPNWSFRGVVSIKAVTGNLTGTSIYGLHNPVSWCWTTVT